MRSAATEQERFFRFLRRLRAEGRSNMYGAVPYLMRSFALDRDRAFRIICDWVDQQMESAQLDPVAPLEPKPRKSVRRRAA